MFFSLGVSTSLRKAGLQYLQWNDIDLNSGRLFVRTKKEHRIKDCEDCSVPLVNAVLILLKNSIGKLIHAKPLMYLKKVVADLENDLMSM